MGKAHGITIFKYGVEDACEVQLLSARMKAWRAPPIDTVVDFLLLRENRTAQGLIRLTEPLHWQEC